MPFYLNCPQLSLVALILLLALVVQLATSNSFPSSSFWSSFWPSVWSGALYSTITGYVILLVFENQRCIREMHTARSQLRSRVRYAGTLDRGAAMYCAPQGATAVSTTLDSYPIDLWLERVEGHKLFVLLLQSVQVAYGEFVGIASQYDLQIRQIIHDAVSENQDNPGLESQIRRRYYDHLHAWVRSGDASGTGIPMVTITGVDRIIATQHPQLFEITQGLKKSYVVLATRLDQLRQSLIDN